MLEEIQEKLKLQGLIFAQFSFASFSLLFT